MAEIELNAMEQRVLGALMEKQTTVPASYPLSLNALRTACNQTSSRAPVTSYEGPELEACARQLKHRELLRVVVADRGQRTLKYHQRLDEHLDLDPAQRALMTVLLLRGPQAPGELKTRTERLHGFADRGAVEQVLAELAERGLTRELPRRAGQHDNRWIHLLGPVELGETTNSAPVAAVDREVVLAQGAEARDAAVRASYDAAAIAYAEGSRDLADNSFDSWLMDRLAMEVTGPIADVGTGTGRVAAYLAEQGADVTGYDISAGMLEQARRRVPGAVFELCDQRRLLRPPTAPGWEAITSWYSLVYLAPSELASAIEGLARVLVPGGVLLLAMHAGVDVKHESELAGVPVDMNLVLHDPESVRAAVRAAGLTIQEWYVRGAGPGEYPTDRLYLMASA